MSTRPVWRIRIRFTPMRAATCGKVARATVRFLDGPLAGYTFGEFAIWAGQGVTFIPTGDGVSTPVGPLPSVDLGALVLSTYERAKTGSCKSFVVRVEEPS